MTDTGPNQDDRLTVYLPRWCVEHYALKSFDYKTDNGVELICAMRNALSTQGVD